MFNPTLRICSEVMTHKILFASVGMGLLCLLILIPEVFSQPLRSPGRLIVADSFERGEVGDRWLVGEKNSIKINYNRLNVHSGDRSMEITALPGKEAGDMARFFFAQGFDRVHARWYCKFDSDFDQGDLMHLNRLSAQKEKWAATAGKRPNGSDFFRTTLDVWRDWGKNPPPGEPVLYSYFPLMKIDPWEVLGSNLCS